MVVKGTLKNNDKLFVQQRTAANRVDYE